MARQCSKTPRSTITRAISAIGSTSDGQVAAGEHLADQPAEQPQPRDAQADRDEADQHGAQDAQAHSLGEVHRRGSKCIAMPLKRGP